MVDRLLASPAALGLVRVLAIDGPAGSGKSTMADQIVADLQEQEVCTALVRADDFATWDEPVQWWPRFSAGVLEPLAHGQPGHYQRTQWYNGVPYLGEWISVIPPQVLVLEGVSMGRHQITPLLSLLIWVELPDPAVRLARVVHRDGEHLRPCLENWQAMEQKWFAKDNTKSRANIVLS